MMVSKRSLGRGSKRGVRDAHTKSEKDYCGRARYDDLTLVVISIITFSFKAFCSLRRSFVTRYCSNSCDWQESVDFLHLPTYALISFPLRCSRHCSQSSRSIPQPCRSSFEILLSVTSFASYRVASFSLTQKTETPHYGRNTSTSRYPTRWRSMAIPVRKRLKSSKSGASG